MNEGEDGKGVLKKAEFANGKRKRTEIATNDAVYEGRHQAAKNESQYGHKRKNKKKRDRMGGGGGRRAQWDFGKVGGEDENAGVGYPGKDGKETEIEGKKASKREKGRLRWAGCG